MKKLLLTFVLLYCSNFMDAQTTSWTNRYNGAGDNSDRYNSMISDGAGNYYLAGYTVSADAGKNFLTVKVNSVGDTVWTRIYNYVTNLDDEANLIAMDGSGNIIVSGSSDGGSSGTKTDFLTIKYNSTGTLLWATRYNYAAFNEDESPVGIALDASSNIYITGRSDHDAGNVDDFATVKYNSSGVQQWVTRYDGGNNKTDRPAGVVPVAAGGCVVTGRSRVGGDDNVITIKYSTTGAQTWLLSYDGLNGDDRPEGIATDATGNIYLAITKTGAVDNDITTIKYSSAGAQTWATTFNSGQDDNATGIKLDAANNVYVIGQSDIDATANLNFDSKTIKYNSAGIQQWVASSGNTANQEDYPENIFIDGTGNVFVCGKSDLNASTSVINYNFFTIKYNSLGVQQWVNYYTGTTVNGEDIPSSILADASGNVYVAGSVDFTATQKDASVLKYNAAGVFQIIKNYNGLGDFTDHVRAMTIDASKNVYVTGYTMGAGRQRDILIQKMNSAGTTLWATTFDGTGEDDEGYAIKTDASGNVYVTGYSNGAGTFDDYVTLKYNSTGVLQWSAIYNFTARQTDKAVSLAVSATGDVYVTGYSDNDPSTTVSNYDYATIKYNAAGLQQWVARYNGTGNHDDRAVKLVIDTSSVYVTGTSMNVTNNDIVTIKYSQATGVQSGIVIYNGSSNGNDAAQDMILSGANLFVTGSSFVTASNDDYVTLKYNTSLAQQWASFYNGTGNSLDQANAIYANATNVYVTGNSIGIGTNDNVAVVRMNVSDGAVNFSKLYSGAASLQDAGYGIAVSSTGYIFSTGESELAAGNADFITSGYDSNGNLLFNNTYNGTGTNDDVSKAIVIDASGNIYVSGYSKGAGTANYDFVTIKYTICYPAAQPGSISVTGGIAKVCPGDTRTYKVTLVAGVTYSWIVPTGATILSGQGTNQIVVNYNAGFIANGTMSVTGTNSCGAGVPRTLTIVRNAPATPSVIAGLLNGVCNATNVPYSITPVTGFTYTWSLSVTTGVITTGQGTGAITANFNTGYVSGSLSVKSGNACGLSSPRTTTIKAAPPTPTSITGNAAPCTNQAGVAYSIAPVSGATLYNWTAPSGSHISDGFTLGGTSLITTSSSVTVNFGSIAGSITCKSGNTCSYSTAKTLVITFSCRSAEEQLTTDNNNLLSDIVIIPNPTTGIASLEYYSKKNSTSLVTVIDMLGQIVYKTQILNFDGLNREQFDFSSLQVGVYTIEINSENQNRTLRLVKQ